MRRRIVLGTVLGLSWWPTPVDALELPLHRDDSVLTTSDGVYVVGTGTPTCSSGGLGTEFSPDDLLVATSAQLGAAAGVAEDRPMGIELVPNPDTGATDIFVASSAAYGNLRNASGARIYCIDGSSGTPNVLVDLTNPFGGGIGDLAYNPKAGVLYASDINDGLVYPVRLDYAGGACPSGTLLAPFDPFGPAAGHPGDIAPASPGNNERIVGLGFDPTDGDGRLYIARWMSDLCVVTEGDPNEIWSHPVEPNGELAVGPAAPERLEIILPHDQGIFSSPVYDVAFDADANRMLLGSRSISDDGLSTGVSSVREYTRSAGSWVTNPDPLPDPPTGQVYAVGLAGNDATGGVSYTSGTSSACNAPGEWAAANADVLLTAAGIQLMGPGSSGVTTSTLALTPAAGLGGLEVCRACAVATAVPTLGPAGVAALGGLLLGLGAATVRHAARRGRRPV
jgi:hypothetical protein